MLQGRANHAVPSFSLDRVSTVRLTSFFMVALVAAGLWDLFTSADSGVFFAGLLMNSLPPFLRKHAEKPERLEMFSWLDHLPTPAIICEGKSGRIIASNPRGNQLLGIDPQANEPYSLDTFLDQSIHKTNTFKLEITPQEGCNIGLTSLAGRHYVSRAYISLISPDPDKLYLILLGNVQPLSLARLSEYAEQSFQEVSHSVSASLIDNPFRILTGILDYLPFAACVTSPDGGFTWYSSNKVAELFSVPMHEMNQTPRWWQAGIHSIDQKKIQEFWAQLLDSGSSKIIITLKTKDDRPFTKVVWKAFLDRDALGNPNMAFHYFYESREAVFDEQWSDQLIDLARQQAGLGLWAWNTKDKKLTWSGEFYALHNLPRSQNPDPIDPFPFMSDEVRFDFKLLLDNINESHLPLHTEYQVNLADGTVKDLTLVVAEVKLSPTGELEFLAGFIQDKTEVKELDRIQRTLATSLMRHKQILKEFSTAVSHRLRVPIAQFKGILNLLVSRSEIPPEQQLQMLNSSAEELDIALHEMNQMLNLERGGDSFLETLRWQDLWKPIVRDFHNQIAEKRASIIVDFSAARDVTGIKDYLQGILTELLTNAIKFRDDIRPLELYAYTEVQDGLVWFHLQDNGLGVDLTGREGAPFELYKRFHAGRSGQGFGLHLVKLWIEALNGKIQMTSIAGEGSRVSVGIPQQPASDAV